MDRSYHESAQRGDAFGESLSWPKIPKEQDEIVQTLLSGQPWRDARQPLVPEQFIGRMLL